MYYFLEDLATVYLRNRTSAESHCSPTGAGTDCSVCFSSFRNIHTTCHKNDQALKIQHEVGIIKLLKFMNLAGFNIKTNFC